MIFWIVALAFICLTPLSSSFDDDSDIVLGRQIVSQMLGSSIYDLDMHPFESSEDYTPYDMVIDHIITIIEMQQPEL
jgi:hypothetical protein